MRIETKRFGSLEIDEESIITMPKGPLGFEDNTRFITIQHRPDTAFRWLQCVDEPSLAFVVVDPSVFVENYDIEISDAEAEMLQLTDEGDAFVLAIVTVGSGGRNITLNLAAPVVVNSKTMAGMQVILQDNRYSVRHQLTQVVPETRATVKAAA
jgi:flagellar assembly factor FliW